MIPQDLRVRPQWLIWRVEQKAGQSKLVKMPYYAGGSRRVGKQGDEKDRARLVGYDAALAVAPKAGTEVGCGGVGFAFLPGDGLIGIDLDAMIDPETGEISERGAAIIKACDSFTEFSPSGKGVHIYVRGDTAVLSPEGKRRSFKRNEIGVEVFCGSQFFTVTGRHYAGTPETVNEISEAVLRRLLVTVRGKPEVTGAPAAAVVAPTRSSASVQDDFKRVNDAALQNLDAWVPALFPSAKRSSLGYRVAQKDLGRDLQEDLSITPSGIRDFGVADMGDARGGGRSPIDLVIEWGASKKPADALHWLAGQLGIVIDRKGGGKRSGPGDAGPPPGAGDRGADDPDDDRPRIEWTQSQLPQNIDQAEAAILKAGLRIYQRAGFLVRVVRRDTPSVRYYKRRPPGSLGLVAIDTPYLVEEFTRAARWFKFSAQKSDWVPMNAPEQAAVTYLARRGHWRLPRLWSAISCPTLRPDGTVLQKPGYDADSASWYDPCGIKFPPIKDSPSHEDAVAALGVLRGAFTSFPFQSPADEAVALALAMTAIVRRSLPAAPLGGITAPMMASGKTLLADCIAILATGVSAPAMKYADTDEEATKTMLAILAEGDQVVLIDNVERPLQGDTLCAVLTSESFRQRVLGRTEMISVPTTTLFLATGNHLVISGDLRTRSLLCRIDPKSEHPEHRQFDVELREWIVQHRPELVAAALTIMRAFIATGQRVEDHCKTWGRFERWSDMVRAPLIWLGCEDPCASLADLEREDPERVELVRVLSAWEACFGVEPYTAREAVEYSRSSDPPGAISNEGRLYTVLRDVCKDRDGTLNVKRLGHWLRTHSDRLVSAPDEAGRPRSRRFVRAGEKDHTLLWRIERMQ